MRGEAASVDTNQLDLVVGRITAVEEAPGSRAPSFLVRLDLGTRGEEETVIDPAGHEAAELEGALVVVALHGAEPVVLTARSHAGGTALVRPERDVEPGTVVA
jgi:tRNA-binding EMAP/Myf-like protein